MTNIQTEMKSIDQEWVRIEREISDAERFINTIDEMSVKARRELARSLDLRIENHPINKNHNGEQLAKALELAKRDEIRAKRSEINVLKARETELVSMQVEEEKKARELEQASIDAEQAEDARQEKAYEQEAERDEDETPVIVIKKLIGRPLNRVYHVRDYTSSVEVFDAESGAFLESCANMGAARRFIGKHSGAYILPEGFTISEESGRWYVLEHGSYVMSSLKIHAAQGGRVSNVKRGDAEVNIFDIVASRNA